ncbi:hypothetical protein [Mesorhizobium japonicum]|uniref:hypothetical protein n=1 Tax=Mesorhizobium japonicum TaxID=2066070 RepID=UPI0012FE8D07|nr:hypothetical protein [Mesorhizobium japonicum]
MESKFIKKTAAKAIRDRVGLRLFDLGRDKLTVASEKNMTDFTIDIDINADRRYGHFDCSAIVIIKWKKFSKFYEGLVSWYNDAYLESAQPLKIFLGASFSAIEGDFSARSRGAFLVSNEEDLEMFITQCLADLNGKVGQWIARWFTWSSALATMEDNGDLCGAWRNAAYFCLAEQVHGRETACSWVRTIDSTNWPEFLAAQVEYLRSNICRLP